MTLGRIHSVQSLGTLDGPGVRSVIFMQGCPLGCSYCHNPDTWDPNQGEAVSAPALLARVLRFREYYGAAGGITVSGGEPLLQADFVTQLFTLARAEGLHRALDTSGTFLTPAVEGLLEETDLVLLDLKFTSEALYQGHTGTTLAQTLRFLEAVDRRQIPLWIRHVVIPGLTDREENILALNRLLAPYPQVEKVELLPFSTLGFTKYAALNLPNPLAGTAPPPAEKMAALKALVRLPRENAAPAAATGPPAGDPEAPH